MDWQTRISVDPRVCHGKACVAGTRVMVFVILDNLADGESPESIAASYGIALDDVQAAIEYAAARVNLSDRGIGPEQAADLRRRLKAFESDWESREMDAYDAF